VTSGGLYAYTRSHFDKRWAVAGHALTIPKDSVALARGRHIATTGIGHYKEEDFLRALREGKRPGGLPSDTPMPFRFTNDMTDGEIRALCMYLKSVPPKAYGGREAHASRWVERTTNGLGRRRT
jgi:hypothetical protein